VFLTDHTDIHVGGEPLAYVYHAPIIKQRVTSIPQV